MIAISFALLVVCASVDGGELSKWPNQREEAVYALFRPEDASKGALALQQAASQGNADAQSDLSLAALLGVGVPQDLAAAEKWSWALSVSGGARAHTTRGLLLAHNLTGAGLTEEERQSQALSHYVAAAGDSDPLAQILAGWHYLGGGDCEAALQYFRRAALFVAPSVPEEVSLPDPPPFVWPEDNEAPDDLRPTLDEFHFVQQMADHGDTDAAIKASVLLYRGMPGLPRDVPAAAAYLQQAVKDNSTSAMVLLAAVLLRHDLPGVEENVRELLETALGFGEQSAHAYLGLLYLKGHGGTPRSLEKARHHLMQGVMHGIVEAIYLLGKVLDEEDGEGRSEEAMALWRMSASIGHVPSALRVAERHWAVLHRGAAPGGDTAIFSQALCHEAVAMYRKVALSGDWRHLLELAHEDYLEGRSSAALMKYLLMSDLGYPSAHVNAGRLLDAGGDGVYGSEGAAVQQALKVWQKAAGTGAAAGYIRLGDLFYYGQGVARDLERAAMYYTNASMLGSSHGLFNTAQMAEWGEGLPRNLTYARQLYDTAADLSEDAAAPVALALLRMDAFLLLNDTLGLDFYEVDWSPPISEEQLHLLAASLPPWDVLLMGCLAVAIAVMIKRRGTHRPR